MIAKGHARFHWLDRPACCDCGDRPPVEGMVSSVDAAAGCARGGAMGSHVSEGQRRRRICDVLLIAPSSCHDHPARQADPTRRSDLHGGTKRRDRISGGSMACAKARRQLRRAVFDIESPTQPELSPKVGGQLRSEDTCKLARLIEVNRDSANIAILRHNTIRDAIRCRKRPIRP